MPYKISGSKNETSRIIVFKESDWSIESNTVVSGTGSYEIDSLATGAKMVIAKTDSGEVLGYGNVTPEEYTSWNTYFSNSYWEPATGLGLPVTGSWDGSKWVAELSTQYYLVIRPTGAWVTGYRPTKIKCQFNLEEYLPLDLYSSGDSPGSPSILDTSDYQEGTEANLSWGASSDLALFWIISPSNFEVTDIQFYG